MPDIAAMKGVPIDGALLADTPNKYKFNGQEWQDEHGLNITAMDYRQYDNAIGRFGNIDKLCEANFEQSPYHFANNNPVYFSDPSGLDGTRGDGNGGTVYTNAYGVSSSQGFNGYGSNGNFMDPLGSNSFFGNMDGSFGGFGVQSSPVGNAVTFSGNTFTINMNAVAANGSASWSPRHLEYVGMSGNFSGNLKTGITAPQGNFIIRGGTSYNNGASVFNYNQIGNNLGAFGLGWGTKQILMQSAVAEARGISIAGVNNISYLRALGSGGATYMKYVNSIGTVATIAGAGVTLADGFENGFKAHHAADLGIQAGIYTLSASVPVAGWIVGGAYFVGDMYFQSTHNGMSITQYYLDNN